MNCRRFVLALACIASGGCAARVSDALVIVGVARETRSGNPWRNGRATLYADSAPNGPPLAQADIRCGFFKLRAPGPGRYRVRVAMIGLEAARRTVDLGTAIRDTLEFRGSYAHQASHGTAYDAVMRPGECPAIAYGAPAHE